MAKICKRFGSIKDIIKKGDHHINAVVIFQTKKESGLALKTLHGQWHNGKQLRVEFAQKPGLITFQSTKKSNLISKKKVTPISPDHNTLNVDLHEFNTSSFLVCSMDNVTIPQYSNKEIKIKLFSKQFPDSNISKAMATISSGLAPQIQLTHGIYEKRNSTTIVAIRNNSNLSMKIKRHQLIKGTNCHLKEYLDKQLL